MKIVEINTTPTGSTGTIMLQIAETAKKRGHEVSTYSRKWRRQSSPPKGHAYFGTFLENAVHQILGNLFGFSECFSYFGTKRLIKELRKTHTDIIHLHNLHGWYIHIPLLFRYIKKTNIKVVWTLHDCWAFTGHCPYFTMAKCNKWKTGCFDCPQYTSYPSMRIDRTKTMWRKKRDWFAGVKDMTIATPSHWLAGLVRQSFLCEYPVKVIHNGVDLTVFKPSKSDFCERYNCKGKLVLLGVAFDWGKRKGLDVFIELSKRLDDRFQIVLVGTTETIDKILPAEIISIHRTANQEELAKIYSAADLFVNPTREENYPTVNMEALACGTPVVTFNTGGSPEIIDDTCGAVVPVDDTETLKREIERICLNRPYSPESCVLHAQTFDRNKRFEEYLELYENRTHCSEFPIQ